MNSAVNGISEGFGVINAIKGFLGESRKAPLSVDASEGKGMLLHTGTEKVKHLRTKQLWAQAAIQSCGVELQRGPRTKIPSGILAHPVGGGSEVKHGLRRLEFHTQERSRANP